MNPEEVSRRILEKIGEGHENDQIVVKNISNRDFHTTWGRTSKFSVEAGKERILLRHIAVKFARELATALAYAEADRAKRPVTEYLVKIPTYIESILVRVESYYQDPSTINRDTADLTEEERQTAYTLEGISVLEELGITKSPIRTSVEDVAANFRNKTINEIAVEKNETLTIAPESIPSVLAKEDDIQVATIQQATKPASSSIVSAAIALGINIPQGATESDIKQLISAKMNI